MVNTGTKNSISLISVDFVTGFSSWVCFICVNWFLLEFTGLSSVVALQSIIYTLAGLVVSPFLGIFIDRYKAKTLIAVVSIARGLASACVGFFVARQFISIYLFYGLNFINGAGFSFYSNVLSAVMRKLDDKTQMMKINSFLDVSLHASSFVAGLVASSFWGWGGITGVLFFNAACFLLSGLIICIYNETYSKKASVQAICFPKLMSGLKYIFNNKQLIISGLLAYFPTLIAACMTLLLPIIIDMHFPSNLTLYSFSHSAYSIGMAIGCLFLGLQISKKVKKDNIVSYAFVVILLCIIILYFSYQSVSVLITMFVFGLACAVIRIRLNADYIISQDIEYTGRVVSVMSTFVRLVQMLSLSLIGFLNDTISISCSVALISAVSLMSMFLFRRRLISMEEK